VDLLRLNTLRGTKTAFLTPKRYDEHPRPFLYGAPPPGVFPFLPTTRLGVSKGFNQGKKLGLLQTNSSEITLKEKV